MQRRNIDPTSLAEIGARLKISRLALGKTQAEMAADMGSSTSGQAWENYEAGRRRISIDHALALSRLGRRLRPNGNAHPPTSLRGGARR